MSSLQRCKDLWIQLDELNARGLEDSDAAEAIRDESDAHWRKLTKEELADFRKWVLNPRDNQGDGHVRSQEDSDC